MATKVEGSSRADMPWPERIRATRQDFSRRFKLGPHYTIERFGVIVAALSLSGALVLGMTVWGAIRAGDAVLGETALYNSSFVASRTEVKGNVEPVYVNMDRDRALVLMKFETPSQMSSNAEDYYVYGTGIDGGSGGGPAKLQKPLAGAIYSFGNTGYLGIVLEAPDGFAPQLINLTVRARKELMTPKNQPNAAGMDKSFIEHDQWRIVINPAASGAVHLAALDSEHLPAPEEIFAYAVTWRQEQAKRQALDRKLADMKTQLTRISNFTSMMAQTSVRVGPDPSVRLLPPALPPEIEGDAITGIDSATVRTMLLEGPADRIEGIKDKTPRARGLDTFSDGYMVNTFVLNSAHSMSGGTDFDWRQRSVADGYFKTLGTGESSIGEYLAKLSSQPIPSVSARDLFWPLSNGQSINDLRPGDTAAKPLIELRNNMMAAYDAYFGLKRSYQTVDLLELLVMEQTLDLVASNSTKASGPDAVSFRA
ncbi:hypothetical protein [Rhodococcus sp. NCIMB 12038]|uniref:hypothetical protein n=1 Tax=Rhodococcus sp. NCIMB 12038 TaxID=933800 RepID=UPI00117A7680|nr:hypothetical protein [Rhodococcus sp. NCIMB 12038]